jgi:hypothetical protein
VEIQEAAAGLVVARWALPTRVNELTQHVEGMGIPY